MKVKYDRYWDDKDNMDFVFVCCGCLKLTFDITFYIEIILVKVPKKKILEKMEKILQEFVNHYKNKNK